MPLLPEYRVESYTDGAQHLIVFCHGLGGSRAVMADLVAAARGVVPGTAIMNVEHAGRNTLSNADPVAVADELNAAIGQAVDAYGFSSVTLVGHSIGALLLRKAYVFALGFNQDSTSPVDPHSWAERVDRMVFLAAFNRGINILGRTPGRSYWRWLGLRAAYTLARLFHRAEFVRRFERGGRFVSNLRLQWLQATNPDVQSVSAFRPSAEPVRGTPGDRQPPPVVQLIGIEDEYVGDDESNDLAVCGSFVRINLQNTNHRTILSFTDDPDGRARRRAFESALGDDVRVPRVPHDDRVRRIVFVMHGIRDFGFWVPQLAKRILRLAPPHTVKTIPASYGYFPMLPFIIWSDRQRNVRWFMDELTNALAESPSALVDFVGHSNGTYLLASALRDYAATKFHNVVFAGSVVRRDFPWDTFARAHRVAAVRNYVASADWVVGILPHFFEFLADTFNLRSSHYLDIGGAGFFGFTSGVTAPDQVTFVKGAHGAAIVPRNWDSIARYIMLDVKGVNRKLVVPTQSNLVSLLSRLCWAIWGAVVGGLVLGLVKLALLGFGWAAFAAFIVLVLYLLTESI
jgi:pimeloyl-ACP methyl ester carboxylesterase